MKSLIEKGLCPK